MKNVYPEPIQLLMNFFKKLPGVGEKNAERMALAAIELPKEELLTLSDTVQKIKEQLKNCSICGHLTTEDICPICSDKNRNHNMICVVEDPKSVFKFENVGNYNGVYHVLNGLISPIENIGLPSLVKRTETLKKPEIILALKSTIEGETTTLYIKKIFEKKDIVISRLSYGIPMGAEIDYLDIITLDKALEDRKKIS